MPLLKDGSFVGAFAYFLDDSATELRWPAGRKCYVIKPPLSASNTEARAVAPLLGASDVARSIELWKEPGESSVKIVATAYDGSFPEEIRGAYPGAKYVEAGGSEPGWVRGAGSVWFFDAEQSHSLPGCWFTIDQPPRLIEALVRAVSSVEVAAWIELSWVSYAWGYLIESASQVMQQAVQEINKGINVTIPSFGGMVRGVPTIRTSSERRPHPNAGSTVHIHGNEIAKEYFEKAQRPGILLSIRGAVVGSARDGVSSALQNVAIAHDALEAWFYDEPRFFRWLRSRALPDPQKMLEMHAAGGFLAEWGRGRELIPDLCLTPEELPIFVHLPRDPQLLGIIDYARAGGLPEVVKQSPEGAVELGE